MFTDTNGASAIVCAPSYAPTGQPTDQPTGQPTSQPTSQPTRDTSFKKHLKDELDEVAGNVQNSLKQVQSGLTNVLKGIRRTVQPLGNNQEF